jgi:hypothetical protein
MLTAQNYCPTCRVCVNVILCIKKKEYQIYICIKKAVSELLFTKNYRIYKRTEGLWLIDNENQTKSEGQEAAGKRNYLRNG